MEHSTQSDRGLSASHLLPLAILLPLSATLLFLAGIILTGTLIGIAVVTPLFVIFSPVLVPAALAISLAVAGFLTADALGVTGLAALAWMANYVHRSRLPEQLEHAKRRAQEAVGHVANRTRDAVEAAQSRAQDLGPTAQTKAQGEGWTS